MEYLVIHFDHGGHYSDHGDEVRWNRKERGVCSVVMNGKLGEITYSRLVSKIRSKIMGDEATTKLLLSYIPLLVEPKRPSYILDDEDVLAYLMEVNTSECRSVLHVEFKEFNPESHSSEQIGLDDELVNDDKVDQSIGDGMELAIVEHVSDDENESVYRDDYCLFGTAYIRADVEDTEVVHAEWEDGLGLVVGQEFRSKVEVQDLVLMAAHRECFEIRTMKSTPTLYVVKCRLTTCSWHLRVSIPKDSSLLTVATYRKMHSCSRLDAAVMKNKQKGRPSLVASVIHEDYPGQFKTPSAKTFVDLVQRRLGVKVSYSTAWRGKALAASDVRGSPEESFYMLPSYLHMLETVNPGTVTQVEVDDDNRFQYLFIALGACVEGFNTMRKVIAVDGTHLKNLHGGVLLIALAQDPEHHHYPIAFGVVDGEKNDSWSWFFNMLKTLIPDAPELVFLSDRNTSIINAISAVYPMAHHGYCILHLCQNVKTAVSHVKKDILEKKFLECAHCYVESEFLVLYDEFKENYPQAAIYLHKSVDVWKWARCYFPGDRYNIESTNSVESLNNVLVDARKLSLLPMIDVILAKIIEWFNKYRKASAEVPELQKLVPCVHQKMHNQLPLAKKLIVQELNTFQLEYSVTGTDGLPYLVDLRMKTCSCKYFNVHKYPCFHALSAIIKLAETSHQELDIPQFCSKYYWTEQWASAYRRTIYPVPHHSTWVVPEEIKSQRVLPKLYKKKKGRIQVTRHLGVGEPRRRTRRTRVPFQRWFEEGENSQC